MTLKSMTCNLVDTAGEFSNEFSVEFDSLYDGTVTFDVTDTTADDVNETVTLADYFNSVIGA